jgi:DNA-binding NarL/FixJ family response regulator
MGIRVPEVDPGANQKSFLTPVDQSILRLQREGRTTHQIAEELKITERVVQLKICQLHGPRLNSQIKT